MGRQIFFDNLYMRKLRSPPGGSRLVCHSWQSSWHNLWHQNYESDCHVKRRLDAFTADIAAHIAGHRKRTVSYDLFSDGNTIKVIREAMVRID